jgi:hypothetical protein
MLHIRAKVLDHDVGRRDEPQQDGQPIRMLEVENQAALVDVQILKIEAVPRAGAVFLGIGCFDFDDLRAHLAELAHAGRPGSGARQIDDPDVRQRPPRLSHGGALHYQ